MSKAIYHEQGTKQDVVGDCDLQPIINEQGTKQNVVEDDKIVTYFL